jgi:predicted ferric reductase
MNQKLPTIPSSRERFLKSGLLFAVALLLLTGALCIPFLFESLSIKYKFGFDKTLLRTGKLLGLGAAVLLLFQLLLGARFKFLDRIFTLPRVFAMHRINGGIIALLALLHPVFILWPEDFTLPPMKLEYWPQAAGFLLLLGICLQAGVSLGRQRLNIAFGRWRTFHRYIGTAIILLMVLHVLFVSETFAAGLPRTALLVTTGVCTLLFVLARVNAWRAAGKRYPLTAVKPENNQVVTLELDTSHSGGWPYLPGQFAFISVTSDRITREAHPFTISSAPTQPDRLAFTIKNCGDWTSQVKHLQAGDTVSMNGPYGLFSHLLCPPGQPLILIAGGIGITPMLSMLRYMRDSADKRQVKLLWSNRSAEDLVCRAELGGIEQDLTGFTMVHTFTGEKPGRPASGQLDRKNLRALLSDEDRSAAVFICGPPGMMAQVARDMRALGFKRSSIHTERFGF